jgi:hypothetical protein
MNRLLVVSAICIAASSCAPDSQKDTTPDRVQFKNLRLEAGQLTGHVVYNKASEPQMQYLLLLEGIYCHDGVWGSELHIIENGHRRPLPRRAAPSVPPMTAVRVILSDRLDPEGLVAVRLRATVWLSKLAPHEANQGDTSSFSYQSQRLHVSDSDAN